MTGDTILGIAGCVLGLAGLAATIWAAYDARKQRSKREVAVRAATNTIERTFGLLIGLKPSVAPLGAATVNAIDNGLAAIDSQRNALKKL